VAEFGWGVLAGVFLAVVVARLNRSTMRGAAFGDAADFLRAMAQDAAFRDWGAPSVLRHAGSWLDAWAKEPSGGRERMPRYGFKPTPSSASAGDGPGKDGGA
jgi:hypothetical protein